MVKVLVVGAGLIGAAIAYESARAGADVVLVDRGGVAERGATRFGFGALSWATATTPATSAYVWRGYERYQGMERELGRACGFRDHQALKLIGPGETLAAAAGGVEQLRERGVRAQLVERQELQELEPALDLSGWQAGERFEQGHLDLAFCVRAWVEAAAARDRLTLMTETTVDGLGADGSSIATSRGQFHADLVFLAAGAWLRPLLGGAGIKLPVFHSQAEFLYSAPTRPLLLHQVMWGPARREPAESEAIAAPLLDLWQQSNVREIVPPVEEHDMVQYADGHLRIGQRTRFIPELTDAADPATRDILLAGTRPLLPEVDRLPNVRLAARPVAFTPDHLPVVGSLPGLPHAIAVATSTSPAIMAPALGESLARFATTGAWDPLLDEWSPERDALQRVAGLSP